MPGADMAVAPRGVKFLLWLLCWCQSRAELLGKDCVGRRKEDTPENSVLTEWLSDMSCRGGKSRAVP